MSRYDDSDALEHSRIRAVNYATACRALAGLLRRQGAEAAPRDVRPPRTGIGEIADEAALSATQLALAFDVHAERLRKRLERLRRQHDDCCTEVPDRRPKEARYLYYVGKVRSVVEVLRASVETSSERPSKKKLP